MEAERVTRAELVEQLEMEGYAGMPADLHDVPTETLLAQLVRASYARRDRPQPIVGFHCDDGPTRHAHSLSETLTRSYPQAPKERAGTAESRAASSPRPGASIPREVRGRLRRSCHASGKLRASRCVGYLSLRLQRRAHPQ